MAEISREMQRRQNQSGGEKNFRPLFVSTGQVEIAKMRKGEPKGKDASFQNR